ncbi:MAG: dipeptide ABC transporter ATP-binding protein [Muribaculaceae bacterium]|nr:dipeptide ABC transporter ATP-binding protein [Muribaculaceae bacterium]
MEKFLEIKNLSVVYKTKKSFLGEEKSVYALNNVSLSVNKGEIFAIAGESGCGKSTLAKSLMRLIQPQCGEIIFKDKNILNLNSSSQTKDFYKTMQIIFQNPYSSLNPKMKIGQILSEPLEINTSLSKKEIRNIVEDKINKVGLDSSVLELYPHEFSGGQRQRIAIARSLILNPEVIIADEPVSALDVSIQAQIINLLKQLKNDFNLTFLFISHDLSVIRYISDRIAVMYLGQVVELGTTEEIFSTPKHPYTKALLSSVPEIDSKKEKDKIRLAGELPSPENIPQGCKFHTRCPYVMDKCKTLEPQNINFSQTHYCNCFLYENSVV